MTPPESRPSPGLCALAERARLLHRNALQTRLRLAEQNRTLQRLARGVDALGDGLRRPAFPRASVRKEAGPVSAPVTASLRAEAPAEARHALRAAWPFAVIGAMAIAAHARLDGFPPPPAGPSLARSAALAPARDALAPLEPPLPEPLDEDRGAEALLLVHEWRPAGEARTLLQILGGELDRPGLPSRWSVERTGPREYLVRFRDTGSDLAFEADLEARSVRPASGAASLFASR